MTNQTKTNLPWKTETEFYNMHSKEIFSKYSFYHASMIGKTKQEFLKHIIKNARIYPKAKIVDLGCGSGYLVDSLKDICEIAGISTSKECIKQAKINYPKSNFEIGNMETYSKPDSTHYLALESIGYTNIEKTFKNAFKNLKTNGIFYIKDLFQKDNETKEEKENREHHMNYWKYDFLKIIDIIKIGSKTGFRLLSYNDLTHKINPEMFLDSLKYNKTEYIVPHKDVIFLVAGEFIFIKK